jgi:hypothetical protein
MNLNTAVSSIPSVISLSPAPTGLLALDKEDTTLGPSPLSSPASHDVFTFNDRETSFSSPATSSTSLPSASTSRTSISPPTSSTSLPPSAPRPRPVPRPANRPFSQPVLTPTLPASTFTPEQWSRPLPDNLLPFPFLSRHITSLPPNDRDDEIVRVMGLSEYDRIQEDTALETENIFNNMDHNPFLTNMSPEPYPDFSIQPESQQDIGAELERAAEKTWSMSEQMQKESGDDTNCLNATPPKSRAARIALKYVSPPQASPPSSSVPLTTASVVPPVSSLDISPSLLSAATSTALHAPTSSNIATPYLLPLHPIQSSSSPPKVTMSLSATVAPLVAADMAKFPVWLKTWYLNFSVLPYGRSWLKLVNKWTELEKGYGFKSPVSTLPRS